MGYSYTEAYERAHQEVFGQMQKQLENISYNEINKQATKKKIIDNELKAVKKITESAAKGAMASDPREAFKAIRVTKYKRIFGGNVNILTPRKGATYVVGTALLYKRRNRHISDRTSAVARYAGPSRSFVLRFIQGGTDIRVAGSRGNNKGGHGNRGKIKARDFMAETQSGMMKASQHVIEMISAITEKQFEKD